LPRETRSFLGVRGVAHPDEDTACGGKWLAIYVPRYTSTAIVLLWGKIVNYCGIFVLLRRKRITAPHCGFAFFSPCEQPQGRTSHFLRFNGKEYSLSE
jgi:hypothetical protein